MSRRSWIGSDPERNGYLLNPTSYYDFPGDVIGVPYLVDRDSEAYLAAQLDPVLSYRGHVVYVTRFQSSRIEPGSRVGLASSRRSRRLRVADRCGRAVRPNERHPPSATAFAVCGASIVCRRSGISADLVNPVARGFASARGRPIIARMDGWPRHRSTQEPDGGFGPRMDMASEPEPTALIALAFDETLRGDG